MRQVVKTHLGGVTESNPGGLWAVEFDDHSIIAVDISDALDSGQRTVQHIEAAAAKYSEAHPEGVLSGVVVNSLGEKINNARKDAAGA